MVRFSRLSVIAAPLLLAACVSMPSGPTVTSFPGSGKSFDQFRADDTQCRQYASISVGGEDATHVQTDSAVRSAYAGTAMGALAGAAIGGHGSAGAGAGLILGVLAGSSAANASVYTVQKRYDNAYVQCMYAKGDLVPMAGAVARYATPAYFSPVPEIHVVSHAQHLLPGG